MPRKISQLIKAKIDKKLSRDRRIKRSKALFALKAEEFREDRNYDLGLVERCYVNNRKELDDVNIIRRIVKAYKKAKSVQKNSPSCYQVSNEWLPIYEDYLKDVMRALENEDIKALRGIYQ